MTPASDMTPIAAKDPTIPIYSILHSHKIIDYTVDFRGIRTAIFNHGVITKTHQLAIRNMRGLQPKDAIMWYAAVKLATDDVDNCVIIFKDRMLDLDMTKRTTEFIVNAVEVMGSY